MLIPQIYYTSVYVLWSFRGGRNSCITEDLCIPRLSSPWGQSCSCWICKLSRSTGPRNKVFVCPTTSWLVQEKGRRPGYGFVGLASGWVLRRWVLGYFLSDTEENQPPSKVVTGQHFNGERSLSRLMRTGIAPGTRVGGILSHTSRPFG